MADTDYLKMLGYGQQDTTASGPLSSGIALMTLQNSINKQETPEDVQANSLQGMAKDMGEQQSLGGSFAKGFLSGTAAGKMSKAAQARQSQNDKLQTLIDYYQKQIENANQIENQARIIQGSNQELMGVMPQVATAAQEAYQTGVPTKLTQIVKSFPMTNQRFNNMEHAPDGASFSTFTRIGDGENMAFHAVYDMPDGSKFMSPVGITQTALNANVLAPMQNEIAKRQFALNWLKQSSELTQSEIDKNRAASNNYNSKAGYQTVVDADGNEAQVPAYSQPSKPLPVGAIKEQDAKLTDIAIAQNNQADLQHFSNLLDSGELNLSLLGNLFNTGRNSVGLSTDESRNLQSFKSTLEKMRNDSLRLNKGVQTEGDSVRAWNELINNISDEDVVKQRLTEIQDLNERAVEQKRQQIDTLRKNYNAGPMDYGFLERPKQALGKSSVQNTLQTLPPGAVQVGTIGGKPAFKTPDGKMFVVK